MGGKFSATTIEMLSKQPQLASLLDFVETRKVVLPTQQVLNNANMLNNAIKIEKLYINRKMNYYNNILRDEATRALLLESRLETSE